MAESRSRLTPQGPDASLPAFTAAKLFLGLFGQQIPARAKRRRKRPEPAATKPTMIVVHVTKADLRGIAFEKYGRVLYNLVGESRNADIDIRLGLVSRVEIDGRCDTEECYDILCMAQEMTDLDFIDGYFDYAEWLVMGANGANVIEARAASQGEAWFEAVEQARALGMLGGSQ